MKNMKIAVLGTLLVSTIALGSTVALAADGATAEKPATRITNAVVTFLENTDPESPVDPGEPGLPVDPTDPVDPETPVEPGTGGPLSLDYASSLNFGKHKISTQDEVYYANSQKVTNAEGVSSETNLYAQVTDKRSKKELVGWTLSVTQNGQFKTAGGDILEGAAIGFLKGNTNTVAANKPNQPSDVTEETTLVPGTDHKLVSALETEGAGTWVYRMGTESDIAMVEEEAITEEGEIVKEQVSKDKAVTLSVPGATTKVKDEVYKTTLTWKLSTVAGDEEGE